MSNSLQPHRQPCEAPVSMRLFRQEHWSGSLFPYPEDLTNPEMELMPPALVGGFSTTEPPGKPTHTCIPSPLSISLTRMVQFLPRMKLHRLNIINHSPQFTWYCAYCGFGQMYDNINASLWYHKEYFHCPKSPLWSVCSSLLSFKCLANVNLFIVSTLFQNVI